MAINALTDFSNEVSRRRRLEQHGELFLLFFGISSKLWLEIVLGVLAKTLPEQ